MSLAVSPSPKNTEESCTAAARWVVCDTGRAASGTRLFCFPPAGSGASVFQPWRAALPGDILLCAIQYPGRETRWGEQGYESLSALADAIARDLSQAFSGDFAFLGHSFGATVALEVTRRLVNRGAVLPKLLTVSGARPPHLSPRERIHHLDDAAFLAKLKEFDGLPGEFLDNQDLLSILLPVIKEDFRLFEQYRYDAGEPLPVPLSASGGYRDGTVEVGDVLAWSIHTSKRFRSRFFEGDHFFPFQDQAHFLSCLADDMHAVSLPPLSGLAAPAFTEK